MFTGVLQDCGGMGDEARAFWITAPGRGEIRAEPLPAPGPDDVLVRTLFTGVSRGTEALVWRGDVPPAERERMRAPFQAGDFGGPVKYGYCNVGRVEHGPEPLRGRLVFCLYPHQTRYVVPADAVHPLPPDVPPGRAVLAANLETAVNGLWDAAPRVGDRVAVIGAGTVGCLAAWLAARIPGTEVQLVEPSLEKAAVARALGVDLVPPERAAADADLVIHASGSPAGLATALDVAGFEATIVELSWYGAREVPAPLGGAFHSRRLTLRASQVGHVAAAQRARWTRRRRMALALELLRDAALDALVSGESPFEELPAVMAALAATPKSTFCHRIAYARAEHPERLDV